MRKRITKNVNRIRNQIKNLWNPNSKDSLFKGDDKLFKDIVTQATVYAEYGCGASTIWVANNTQCKIYSTDSSEVWLDSVKGKCTASNKLNLHHSDVGTIGKWGRPLNYDKSETFEDYTNWIWEQDELPDFVLVDGRFRVCCFLTSLLNAKQGTILVFDDYRDREQYHFVERFVKPTKMCGRQAHFIVPEKDSLDLNAIAEAVNKFRFVFD